MAAWPTGTKPLDGHLTALAPGATRSYNRRRGQRRTTGIRYWPSVALDSPRSPRVSFLRGTHDVSSLPCLFAVCLASTIAERNPNVKGLFVFFLRRQSSPSLNLKGRAGFAVVTRVLHWSYMIHAPCTPWLLCESGRQEAAQNMTRALSVISRRRESP